MASSAPTEDAALATFLTRIETKLDVSLARVDDHEGRIRVLEERDHVKETRLNKAVTYKDLWLGLTGAAGAGAAVASLIRVITGG